MRWLGCPRSAWARSSYKGAPVAALLCSCCRRSCSNAEAPARSGYERPGGARAEQRAACPPARVRFGPRACYVAGARVECVRWHADPCQRTAYALGTIKAVLYDGNGAPGMLDAEVDLAVLIRMEIATNVCARSLLRLSEGLGERGLSQLWRDR